jgi:hypothetical protein
MVLTVVAAAAVLLCRDGVHDTQERVMNLPATIKPYPYPFYAGVEVDKHTPEGKWLAEHLPKAVVMCRGPWQLLYYAGPQNKAISYPLTQDPGAEGAEEMFAIARYYRVTHVLLDCGPWWRKPLEPYVTGTVPGFKPVAGSPEPLFELDWDVLPKNTVEDIWGQ